jgi:hypothetical protein
MRVLNVMALVLGLAACTVTQGSAQGPSNEPVGNLAHVMRGIFFPNSNILFDVQTTDPDAPAEAESGGAGATSRFAGIYTGWPVVENAAVALAEAANLLMIPGRMCENGEPVPVDRADWIEYARGMQDAGKKALEAARSRSQEAVSEVTNDIAGACSNCHSVYRDVQGGNPERCK